MKLVQFEAASAITQFDSRGATIAGIARCSGHVQVAFLQLEPGGFVGMHQAACPQLFLVVEGEGRVRSGEDEPIAIAHGQGAFWDAGELHETVSDAGLTAIVVEGETLELF